MISQTVRPPAPLDPAAVAQSLRPFGESRMLPRAAYVDQTVFEWEKQHMFGGGWVFVGRSDQVASPGDMRAESLGTASFNPWALGISLLTLLIFEGVRRLRPKWPEALIGLSALAIGAKLYTLHHTGAPAPFLMVRDEGALTAIVPGFAGYPFGPRRFHLLPELGGTAIAISILGMLEAVSITKGLAAKSGQKIEPNQELIGMGAANIACALFGQRPGTCARPTTWIFFARASAASTTSPSRARTVN